MLFSDDAKKRKCPNCNYIAYPPYPISCPKCKALSEPEGKSGIDGKADKEFVPPPENNSSLFSSTLNQNGSTLKKKNQISTKSPIFQAKNSPNSLDSHKATDLTKMLKINTKKGVVFANQTYQPSEDVSDLTISKSNITDTDDRIKVKVKKKKIDLAQEKIDLGKNGEYLRYVGITTKERQTIFSSNKKLEYFLELGSNLDYIATSILSGELDRMLLMPPKGGTEEMCYFLGDSKFLFIIYGHFQDKKATWFLNQMKISLYELLKVQDPATMKKIDLYSLSQNYEKRITYMIGEYIKFDDIFSPNKLKSVDDFLRIDYFGLSYQSIGVISSLITNNLDITGMPPVDSSDPDAAEAMIELKEALITAKIEAIAANTVANTSMMPHWISVKLGFQRYRFILFSETRSYYISLLAEGNPDFKETILDGALKILDKITEKPFIGVLSDFQEKIPLIKKFLKKKKN